MGVTITKKYFMFHTNSAHIDFSSFRRLDFEQSPFELCLLSCAQILAIPTKPDPLYKMRAIKKQKKFIKKCTDQGFFQKNLTDPKPKLFFYLG